MFALIGLLMVGLSTQHYFSVQAAIEADSYEPMGRWVMLSSLIILLLGAGVIYVLLSIPTELKRLPFWSEAI